MAPVSYCAGLGIGHCEARICVVREQALGEAQLVASETGSRSLPLTLAFSAGGEWIVGDAANAQMAKNKAATIRDVLALLPHDGDDEEGEALTARLAASGQSSLTVQGNEIVLKPSGFSGDEGGEPVETTITAEGALAKMLEELKKVADNFVGAKSEDRTVLGCVVACDVTDESQRAALMRAFKTARLQVLQQVPEATAVALRFSESGGGVSAASEEKNWLEEAREGAGKPPVRSVVVVDVGGSRAKCTVLARSAEGVLRTVGYSETDLISGSKMTQVLEKHCATFIERKQKLRVADGGARALFKLQVACERAARLLASGATQADMEAEALVDGVDCRVRLTKARYDDLALDLYKKIPALVQDALSKRTEDNSQYSTLLLYGGAASKAALIRKEARTVLEACGEIIEETEMIAESAALIGKKLQAASLSCEPEEAATYGAALQAGLLIFGETGNQPAEVIKQKKKIVCERAEAVVELNKLPFTVESLSFSLNGASLTELVGRHSPLPLKLTSTVTVAEASKATFFAGDRELARVDLDAGAQPLSLALDADANLRVTIGADLTFECPAAAAC